MDAAFVSVMLPGSVATAGPRKSGWVEVCFANQTGWADGDFLAPADS